MSAVRPESLLTRAEQLLIAIAIPAVAILTRLLIGLVSAPFTGHPFRAELVAVTITIAMFLPFPAAVSAMVRAVASRRRSAEIAVLVVFSLIGALASFLWLAIVAPPMDFADVWPTMRVHFPLYAPAMAVFLSLTACFIAAIHHYRIAIAQDARRFEAEAESARRARQSVEQQMTPGLVVAVLQTVASRLASDPDGAERLLLRLARHQRLLLQSAAADFEDEMKRVVHAVSMIRPDLRVLIRGSGSEPAIAGRPQFLLQFQRALLKCPAGEWHVETAASRTEVTVRLPAGLRDAFGGAESVSLPLDTEPVAFRADDTPVSATPSVPVVYPLLVYLAAVVHYDLGGIDWWQGFWNCAVMTLVSAACWLFVGPLLQRAIRATVALRLPVAIASASALILAAALLVTGLSALFLYVAVDGVARGFFEHALSVMAWRNSLPALVIGASALMAAYGRVMVAASASAARAHNETVRAETQSLENRFHPHFLFNALNSIAAFMREDRAAAARMCLQLSRLVERTVAFAGDRWWAVENEVELIAEYLAIQRIRFGERLQIEEWDVPAEVRRRPMPRLVLQPLLENIFKHAVASSARPIHAGLTIRKRRRGIEISLWNSIAGAGAPLRFGRGLTFVSGRIRDAAGTMTIGREASGGRFTIRCFIPQPL